MKPRRTEHSNKVFTLPGGNEDNDLWVELAEMEGDPVIISVWELTEEERRKIGDGHNVQLVVWGSGMPPVAVSVTDEKIGKRPRVRWLR